VNKLEAGSANCDVLALLSRRPIRAYFVAEIGESLRRLDSCVGNLETALESLEVNGAILLRSHACADPHLEGADLRIVALIEADQTGQDPRSVAGALIDRAWERRIGDYLANHRCV
jgi:hypothetical protein